MVLGCDFAAGWIAGMGGLIVGHPIDTIKVRQQINGTLLLVATKDVYRNRGVIGFYRGMATPLISNGMMNSIFFGFYTGALDYINDLKYTRNIPYGANALVPGKKQNRTMKKDTGLPEHFIAGCVGGAAQLTVACPVDLVKVQLQGKISMNASSFRGPIDCILQILRTNGIKGLYRGIISQGYRDIPSSGAYFVIYEVGKRKLPFGETNSKFTCFVAGGIAGMLSWWSILPLDVIKSRIQADSHQNPKYNGIIHCTKHIFRTEGFIGFFRGFLPLTIRAFPVNGTTFVIYEYLHTYSDNAILMQLISASKTELTFWKPVFGISSCSLNHNRGILPL